MSSDEVKEPICRLSHPAHLHTLSRRAGKTSPAGCFGGAKIPSVLAYNSDEPFHYYCTTCDVEFHDGCHLSPRKITHPYHPQHPLIFSVLNPEASIVYDCNVHECFGLELTVHADSSIPNHGNIFDKCTWCGRNLKDFAFFYRCSLCTFCLDMTCSKTIPLPTITDPKSHHHSLNFLPRPLLIPCDACGLVKQSKPSYACFQCNYVVHKSCIDLPRDIKLTRHPHRLFYSPFLSPTISTCRLCYKRVDTNYGQYSCTHDDCSYVVHSKCATHKKVWDGRELEWEPEEFDETEDVAPFEKVGDGLIKYFSHEHHLKLEKYDGIRDSDKQCQACILHIDSRDFYNCMQCDFFLHEVCANLPRKLDHALHHHPLFLDPVSPQEYDSIQCSVCARTFTGFIYKCTKNNCEDQNERKFQIDVGCILVPDCFTHKSHEHPLFIPISSEHDMIFCGVCGSYGWHLQCTICKFALCYVCATTPDKLHYKYDALPLSLIHGEVSDETYWCEVCETELDPSKWFYKCNKSNITIHCGCVFGSSAYMKPGYTFIYNFAFKRGGYTISTKSLNVKVLCNSSNTRPICRQCHCRCSSSVYFKLPNETASCSLLCVRNSFFQMS